MIDVASGKTNTKKLAPNREGLDEFTEFAISLVNAPDLYRFHKINDHQYLMINHFQGGKSMGDTDIFIVNDDGSVIYQYGSKARWDRLDIIDVSVSKDKLYFSINLEIQNYPRVSKVIDLSTGEEKDYTGELFPKDEKSVLYKDGYLVPKEESIVKNMHETQIESMTNADFLKRTGIRPKTFDKANDSDKPEVYNGLIKLNNTNICYRYISSYSSFLIDFVGAYDSKTWKKIWSQDGFKELYFLGDQYLIVDDGSVRIVYLANGKVVYELKNAQVSSFVDDLLFATSRTEENSRSAVIKAVNLKKIVEKFK